MIISKITGDCPKCGSSRSFGNCLVSGSRLIKGCRNCSYSFTIELPKLRKKILYLDQCFLSSLFRKDNPQAEKAGSKISQLAFHQQLVCPFSGIHETESLQWIPDRRDDLFKFIKQTARGHRFKLSSEIQTVQMHRSLKQFLNGKSKEIEIMENDAIGRNLHDWDNYIWIDTKISLENPDETQELKGNYAQQLVALFPKWKQQNLTFKELFQEESGGAARMLAGLLIDTIGSWCSPDASAFLFGSQTGQMMFRLLSYLQKEVGSDDAVRILGEYLQSDHFRAIPNIYVSVALNAKLRQRVQQGYYSNLEKAEDTFMGFYYDTKFISAFGPYCDAIFVDNTMRQWIEEKDVDFSKRFNVRCFSQSNLDEMLAWLVELEESISQDIRSLVAEIYY